MEQDQQKGVWTQRPKTPVIRNVRLHAVVEGSPNPTTVDWPNKLTNGDFTIQATNSGERVTGDGREEYTWWAFDFTACEDWKRIIAIKKLGRVSLQLHMDSHDRGTDALRWLSPDDAFGGEPLNEPFADLAAGGCPGSVSLTIELLDHWSPEEIVGALMTSRPGLFAMEYADDALIRHAELSIEALAYVSE